MFLSVGTLLLVVQVWDSENEDARLVSDIQLFKSKANKMKLGVSLIFFSIFSFLRSLNFWSLITACYGLDIIFYCPKYVVSLIPSLSIHFISVLPFSWCPRSLGDAR